MTVSPDSTRTASAGASLREAMVPALTVLWHPRLERVGQRALLLDAASSGQVQVSRYQPSFGPPGAAGGEALGDVSVSRQPLVLRVDAAGVTLSADAEHKARVGGQRLSPSLRLPSSSLESGVVLELSSHVALVLHWVSPAPRSAAALGLVGESDGLHVLRKQLLRSAAQRVPVLLLGESGTGKELAARAVHEQSARAAGPFVAVNMAAIPSGTAAAALFGHAKGAFTGAETAAPGYFGLAEQGTLFLDEIAASPREIQAALLRVLEMGEVQTVGGGRPRAADVRVVAATDADLDLEVAAGRFLLPLLHRLRGYELRIPPLRERREDVGRLLRHFLSRQLGQRWSALAAGTEPQPWLAARLVAELAASPLPGNVRQLEQVARRLCIDWGDAERVELASLLASAAPPYRSELGVAPAVVAAPRGAAPRSRSAPSESDLLAALEQADWRPSAAARRLGVSRTTIYALIRRTPTLATAAGLSAEALREQLAVYGGDLDRTAQALRVSRRGLLLRLRELELGGGGGQGPP